MLSVWRNKCVAYTKSIWRAVNSVQHVVWVCMCRCRCICRCRFSAYCTQNISKGNVELQIRPTCWQIFGFYSFKSHTGKLQRIHGHHMSKTIRKIFLSDPINLASQIWITSQMWNEKQGKKLEMGLSFLFFPAYSCWEIDQLFIRRYPNKDLKWTKLCFGPI